MGTKISGAFASGYFGLKLGLVTLFSVASGKKQWELIRNTEGDSQVAYWSGKIRIRSISRNGIAKSIYYAYLKTPAGLVANSFS
jgi:hypothetical protein